MFVSFSPISSRPGPLAAAALAALPAVVEDPFALAARLGASQPVPGDGATTDLWEALATIGARDLGAVRAIEPHLDAVAILSQAGTDNIQGNWGVFASEGGDDPLVATDDDGFTLSGTKQWCSLADRLDAALVTAADAAGNRHLFAVQLRQPGVRVEPGAWAARGLTEIPSGPVHFDRVPATAVGRAGWYLERPGFAWGGIGVAACWYGGAVGIARTVFQAATRKSDQFLYAQLGAIDELLQTCRRALAEAAQLADSGSTDGRLTSKRVRATVARACEEIIGRAGHALGPGPLALDAEHAKRVADLQLYVRQHHGEKDEASLGEALAGGDVPW